MHVGLIGAAGFGRHHLAALQASPHVSRITLAGRRREALEELRGAHDKVAAVSTDYQELIHDPGIDLLDLVLPHDLHLPVAMSAFQHGKHVIVEKPPARTVADFDRMIHAADTAGRRLFVVMNLLFSPLLRAARQVVDSGAIGQPFYSLESATSESLAIYRDPENWRADRERCGGGLLIDGGFHSVYRQLFLLERLGAPQCVTADAGQIGVDEPAKGEDFIALTLAYPRGARAHLAFQWTARAGLGRCPAGILGTEGSLLFTGDSASPLVVRRPARGDEKVVVAPGPTGFQDTVQACVSHTVECLATGAEPHAGTDLARCTLQVIERAYQAAEEGRRLPLDGRFQTHFPPLLGRALGRVVCG